MRKFMIILCSSFFLFGLSYAHHARHAKHPHQVKAIHHRKVSTTQSLNATAKAAETVVAESKTLTPTMVVKTKPIPKQALPVLLEAPKKLALPDVPKVPLTEPGKTTPATIAMVAAKITKTTNNPSNKWMSVDMDWASLWHWQREKNDAKDAALNADMSAMDKPASICAIVAKHPDWYRAAKVTEAKWGVPVNVQFAIMHTESQFNSQAKNPDSTAFGFAQALRGTWSRYQNEENSHATRTNFSAASDFIGWYASHADEELGIQSSDAYRLYLAYHDGSAAYKRQERQGQFKMGKLAHHVQNDADNFADQLSMCTLV